MSNQQYIPNIVTLKLDYQKCVGCGMCADVCPHDVFKIIGRKATVANRDACMECGACARNCAVGAVTVNAGVGCAAAVLSGIISGTEPKCDCC